VRTRTLVALVVVACALAVAWFALRGAAPPDAAVAVRAPLFAADEVPLEQVDRVELVRPGAPALVFVRDGAGWTQAQPFPHPADAASIRAVVDAFAALERSRAIDPGSIGPEARAALGLEPPKARVTLGWKGGQRSIDLGRRTIAGRAWAHVDGRPEAVSVDTALHALAVDADPRQWRAMRLWDAARGDVGRIEVRYGPKPEQRVTLERKDGRWRSTAPFATRLDADAVRSYVEALARAEGDAFAADQPADLAAFGLAAPERGVTLARAGGASGASGTSGASGAALGAIDVGAPVAEGAPERFARVDGRPAVMQLGTKALAAMFPPPAFFVDPRGCDAVPADVKRVQWVPFLAGAPGEPAWTLERSLDAWTIRPRDFAQPVPANAEAVRKLLAQLCEARAPAVAFQPMPDALRLGEFVLTAADGTVLARIRVAREPEGQWALDNEDGVLRVFPAGSGIATEAPAYGAR
jgi:hypothetical protein